MFLILTIIFIIPQNKSYKQFKGQESNYYTNIILLLFLTWEVYHFPKLYLQLTIKISKIAVSVDLVMIFEGQESHAISIYVNEKAGIFCINARAAESSPDDELAGFPHSYKGSR